MQLRALRISIGWNVYRNTSYVTVDDECLKLEGAGDLVDNCHEFIDIYVEYKDIQMALYFIADEYFLETPEDIRFLVGLRVSPNNKNELIEHVKQKQYLSDEEYNLVTLEDIEESDDSKETKLYENV